MLALRELQAEFRQSVLFGNDAVVGDAVVANGLAVADRLRIYRNTARITMIAALRLSFPAVDALVGGDFFEMAAARFSRASPPTSGCLADFGGGFPAFLAALPEAAGVPYLPDVGRFEWALAAAATAPDTPPLAAAALSEVPAEQAETIRFTLHPALALLRLAYPADRIADAALAADSALLAAIDLAEGPITLLIERPEEHVKAGRIDAEEADFVARLLAGAPLGALITEFGERTAALLASQFAAGRIVGTKDAPA
jgi:hypothetical protein